MRRKNHTHQSLNWKPFGHGMKHRRETFPVFGSNKKMTVSQTEKNQKRKKNKTKKREQGNMSQ